MDLKKLLRHLPAPPPFLLAIGGVGIVLFAIGMGLLLVPQNPPSPADLLPADATAAYFAGINAKDAALLKERFPLLTPLSLPKTGQDVDVAIVHLPDGTLGTVTFIGGMMLKTMDSRLPLDTKTFAVRPSSEAVSKILAQEKMTPLSALSSFQELTQNTQKPWGFIDSTLMKPTLDETDRTVLQSLSTEPHLLLNWHDASLSLSVLRLSLLPALSNPPPLLSPRPSLSATFSQGKSVTDMAALFIPKTKHTAVQGKLDLALQALLGKDVSALYDLQPLLQKETTVAMSRSGTLLHVLLLGRGNGMDLRSLTDRLHTSVLTALPTQVVNERHLKEGYASVTIEDDPSIIEQGKRVVNGWTVRTSRRKDTGEGLVSALRGDRFIFTNDREWMDQLLSSTPVSPAPLPSLQRGTVTAAGMASRTFFRDLMEDALPLSLPDIILSTFHINSDQILWSIARDGEVLTLSVQETE